MEAAVQQLGRFFPCWDGLTQHQRQRVEAATRGKAFAKGELLHGGGEDCTGLLLVQEGRLRVYILSPQGKEITLYRLFEGEVCLFSAACVLRNIHFDVYIAAERDSRVAVVPAEVYNQVARESLPLTDYTSQLMAARFSDVMWVVEQVLFTSFDSRLASFLLEQSLLEGADTLAITHEEIARHLGSAREVVTRMLRYFSGEGLVALSRGTVTLTDTRGLSRLVQQ